MENIKTPSSARIVQRSISNAIKQSRASYDFVNSRRIKALQALQAENKDNPKIVYQQIQKLNDINKKYDKWLNRLKKDQEALMGLENNENLSQALITMVNSCCISKPKSQQAKLLEAHKEKLEEQQKRTEGSDAATNIQIQLINNILSEIQSIQNQQQAV